MPYPEHEKMQAVKERSQAIGGFLEWLDEKGVYLCRRHEHSDGCWNEGDKQTERRRACGYSEGDLVDEPTCIEKRLAEYFSIDLNRIEAEKREMLASLAKAY